jgi:membrane protein YqaA with SNARE-associated domain
MAWQAMLARWYVRVLALAGSRRAPLWLALVSFAEASCFPIPPDALLIPMVVARPQLAWRLATICTLASVAGGALGYLIGAELFDRLARPLLDFYGYANGVLAFQSLYDRWGLWVILIKGLTPIPYKIVTIASGAAHFDFPTFMAASLVTRGARFFLLAALLRRYGEPIRAFIERRLGLVTGALAAGVVGGFLMLRFL